MSKGYNQSDRDAAMRCVDCPSCGQKAGFSCTYLNSLNRVRTHKRRIDKYFNDTYGPESPAVNQLLAEAESQPKGRGK